MDDDDEMERAIALSLLEAHQPPQRFVSAAHEYVHDDDEAQFNRDLQAAIDASKAEASGIIHTHRTPPPATKLDSIPQASAASGSSSFMSERAQMEKARLERQKRMRRDAGLPDIDDTVDIAPPAKRSRGATPACDSSRDNVVTSSYSYASYVAASGPLNDSSEKLYWDGELRQTANKHVEPRKDGSPTFRLSELIGPKSDISFAILSSYALEQSCIYPCFDPETPVILVAQPEEGEGNTIKNISPNWVMTMPYLRMRGCMHVKLLLIFYKSGRLRIVIPTANFVDYDWRDIKNSVFVQDIPLRPSPIRHKNDVDFPSTLVLVLSRLNVMPALTSHLNGGHPNLPLKALNELRMWWDWSKVTVQLVASLAGKHEGWPEVVRTGHPALMKAVRDIHAQAGSNREVVLECQGSSIGTYSTQWMNEFHCSARGDSAQEWLDRPKARRTKLPFPPIKVLFPTLQTVEESVLGVKGGKTMFCKKSQWEGTKFPRELFHDSRSKRGRVLMHSKMIIATFKDKQNMSKSVSRKGKQPPSDSEGESDSEADLAVEKGVIGWAYVGSHNFTPSAWGTLSGSAFSPILNITNFELGVVFPIRSEKELDDVACWERPPKKYDLIKDRPWIKDEFL